MPKVQLKIIFKPSEGDQNIDQVIDQLVNDTIKKVLTKYASTGYNIIDQEKN